MRIEYKIIRSSRRTMAIEIKPDGQILVRIPNRVSDAQARKFVESKADWIKKTLLKIESRAQNEAPIVKFTDTELKIIKKKAKKEIPVLVDMYASKIGVSYNRISIRAQKTLWGSCTAEGNLNFNCLLVLLPERIMRYVVVHELCHRKEMNHSKRFWYEVSKIIPDYRELRKQLKETGNRYLERL
ncbi:MAG: M48 family metallopeptidase [Lachnospiraceae bacterium]|nr:M48 family metallopeptidase [Lachnospiraceae bacterium]